MATVLDKTEVYDYDTVLHTTEVSGPHPWMSVCSESGSAARRCC